MIVPINTVNKFDKYFKEGLKWEMIVLNSYNRKSSPWIFEKVILKNWKIFYIFLHNVWNKFSPFSLFGYSFERDYIKDEWIPYSELLNKFNTKYKSNFTCFDSVNEYKYIKLNNDIKFDLNITEESLYFNEKYRDLYESMNSVNIPLNSTNKKELIKKYHIDSKKYLFIGFRNEIKPIFYEEYLNEIYYGSNDSWILNLGKGWYQNAKEEILKKWFNKTNFEYYISEKEIQNLSKPTLIFSLNVTLEELKELDEEKYNTYFEWVDLLKNKLEKQFQENLSSIKKLNQEEFDNLKRQEEKFIENNSQFIKTILKEKIGRNTSLFFEWIERLWILFDNEIKTYLKNIENKKNEQINKEKEKKEKLLKNKGKKSNKYEILNNKFIVNSSGSFTGFIERTYEVEIPKEKLIRMSKEEIEEYLKNNYTNGSKINETINIDDDYSTFNNFTEKK